MIQAEVRHPSSLSPKDAYVWQAYCAATPAFRSPLLGPEFAQLVGRVRDDTRVAVFRRAGQTLGFLAFHHRRGETARPIGAPFSDYHALITAPGAALSAGEALAAAHIGAFRFNALVDPAGSFPDIQPSELTGHVLELEGSTEDRHAALKAANPKRYKNWKRLQSKLEREYGELELRPGAVSQADLDQLICWKRDQYHRSGLHDVLRPDWARALHQCAFEQRDGELRGVLTTLHAGGRLVAGHFGVAAHGVHHTWLSAMDPDCASAGPGQVLMLMLPEVMSQLGLQTYDLGPGYTHYKAPFCTGEVTVGEGLAVADGPAGFAARRVEDAWTVAGAHRIEVVSRIRRRMDNIAAAEISLAGRVRGMVEALTGSSRRAACRETPAQPVHARDEA